MRSGPRQGRCASPSWRRDYILFLAAQHDPQGTVRQRPLQRLRLAPRGREPGLPFRWLGQDPGYAVSLRIRKRIEEGFGWTKEVAGLAQVKLRGLARVDFAFVLSLAAYNLVRLPKLLPEASP